MPGWFDAVMTSMPAANGSAGRTRGAVSPAVTPSDPARDPAEWGHLTSDTKFSPLSPEQLASIPRGTTGAPLQTGTVRSLGVPGMNENTRLRLESEAAGYGYGGRRPDQPYTPGITQTGGAQDPRAFFNSLFPGSTLSPQQLAAKEQELAAQGIRLLGPNAAGMRTKIELPNGQIVDVIGGAGAGHNRSQWMLDGGPRGTAGGPQGMSLASLGGQPVGFTSGSAQSREAAHAGSPGYQFIMKEALGALDRSAASRGTILTGGHLKDLQDRAAGLASTDFGNEWGRTMGLAQLGFNAATNQGSYGSMYGNQLTDLTTGAGNAQAAGTVGAGNAWNSALGNMGQGALDAWGLYRYGPQGGARQ